MCPPNERRRSEPDEEKPRNTRRWEEAPRKRLPARDEDKSAVEEKSRKGPARRQDHADWSDELDVDDDLDDVADLDLDLDDVDLDNVDLDNVDLDDDLPAEDDDDGELRY